MKPYPGGKRTRVLMRRPDWKKRKYKTKTNSGAYRHGVCESCARESALNNPEPRGETTNTDAD